MLNIHALGKGRYGLMQLAMLMHFLSPWHLRVELAPIDLGRAELHGRELSKAVHVKPPDDARAPRSNGLRT
jgi:hypothetical protein